MDLSDQEARLFLRALFPKGLRDPEIVAELCPEGWDKSPLVACYLPPPETAYREYLEGRENLRRLRDSLQKRKAEAVVADPVPEEPELTFGEFVGKYSGAWEERAKQLDPVEEAAELLALCLWDVFSDNHDVVANDGRVVNLGSFRGTAGEIADFFDERPDGRDDNDKVWCHRGGIDYMRFYMGTIWLRGRADLSPVYRLIFRRLKDFGADWRYAFPQLFVVSPGELTGDAVLPYDPSAAVAAQLERVEKDKELERMRFELSESAKAARRAARAKPPPATVLAYQEVFRKFPDGWPPDPYAVGG